MDFGYLIIVLGVIFFSMTLHEVTHGLVSNRLGDDTARLLGRLTLNPMKHIDPFLTIGLPMIIAVTNMLSGANMPIFGGAKPVPFNPSKIRYGEWGVALVAISGPLVNLAIAFISFATIYLLNVKDPLAYQILEISLFVNLGFFVFNILPIPPLDGSRVIYALAPDFVRQAMDAIERYSLFLIFALVIVAGSLFSSYMMSGIKLIIYVFSLIFGINQTIGL